MKKVRTRKTGMQELTIAWMIFAVLFLGVFIRPVNVQASKVKLNKSTVTIYRGVSTSLKVSGSKKKVKWSSSKKSVVSVSSGKVKGIKAGTAYIYAKVGKRTLKCKVTVKEPDKSKRINLAKKEAKKICKKICNCRFKYQRTGICSVSVFNRTLLLAVKPVFRSIPEKLWQ